MNLMFERNGKRITVIWSIFLFTFYIAAGYLASAKIVKDREESKQRQEQRIDPGKVENGRTAVNHQQLEAMTDESFDEVNVGMYVDRITSLSTKNNVWTVDFYIWFNWENQLLAPGDNFQVVDGEISKREKVKSSQKDGQHYALYRVTANITKFFNVVRYPRDNHLLTINIEDKNRQWKTFRYKGDVKATQISSRAKVPGYELISEDIISQQHAYKTSRGDPELPSDYQSIYSQITYAINIKRPDWGLYFKMFQGLFASVAISMLAFILGVSAKERYGLGVGAFFASVGSSYINLNHLPGVGVVTLVDMTNGLAMSTIFLTLLCSTISSRIASDGTQLEVAKVFNKVSLLFFVIGFTAVNVAMALLATG